jgi:hypothetical protein
MMKCIYCLLILKKDDTILITLLKEKLYKSFFQLSPYTEWVNQSLSFCRTHMSPQINGRFIRFAKKKKMVEIMMCNISYKKKCG